jgi:opacity protein-like surface antigen
MQALRMFVIAAWLIAMAGAAAAADAGDPPAVPPAETYAQESFYFRGDAGWSRIEPDAFDLVTVGIGIGYQYSSVFRTDLRFDYGFAADSPAVGDKMGSVTANAYLDLPLGSWVRPYVGAGVGWGFANTVLDGRKGLAAALMAGLTFDLDRDTAVDVGYRFRTISTGADIFADDNPHDHAVMAGLRFKY